MPFGGVVNKEVRARKEIADEEAKIKGPLQGSSATRHLSEQPRTVLFLGLLFSYHFLNMR